MTIKAIHLSSVESIVCTIIDDTNPDTITITKPYEIIPAGIDPENKGIEYRVVKWARGVDNNSDICICRKFIVYETDKVDPKILTQYQNLTN